MRADSPRSPPKEIPIQASISALAPRNPAAKKRVSCLFITVAALLLGTAILSLTKGGLRGTRDTIVLTMKNVSYLMGFSKRYQMHYETEPTGTETQLISPLDTRNDKNVLLIQRENKITTIDALHYELHTSIELVKKDPLKHPDGVDQHFKMEANISFPRKMIEEEKQQGGITVSVMYNFLPTSLTFLYTYADCLNIAQPVRVIQSPVQKDIKTFQRGLLDNPEQGELIDFFRCVSTPSSDIYFTETEISTIRVLSDVNFDKKEFTMYTCSMMNRVCTQTYRSTLPIDVDRIDVNDLSVTFLFSRHNGTANMPEARKPPISAQTWVEMNKPK